MTAEELLKRVRPGEDTTTEFKGLVQSGFKVDAKDIAKEIVALANTQGGYLLLGVEDDRTITGAGNVEQMDEQIRAVSQVCQDSIQPPLTCSFHKVEVEGTTVLVVEVPSFSPDGPHGMKGKFYIRDGNRSRDAQPSELRRLLQSRNYHFDEQPVEGTTPEDLDLEAARTFLAPLYDEPDLEPKLNQILIQLRCVTPAGIPTVSGILLFGREPQQRLPDARISAVLIRGTEDSTDFADRHEIGGRLLDQIDAAVEFLKRNVRAPSRVEGLERKEEGIPERVLREAVLNAVAHRDYRAASQIRIFVFDDRVEIVNPGELLNQLTIEAIRLGGITQRRNPILAGLLARARRRENLGMGVPEIFAAMKKRGLPPPDIKVEAGQFRLVLRLEGARANA